VGALTDRYLRKINPALVTLRQTRTQRYDQLSAELTAQAADPAASPAVCVIRPPTGALMVGQLEHRTAALATAASHGLRAAWMALEGEDPEVLSALRAYPRRAKRTQAATATDRVSMRISSGTRGVSSRT
jgi:hypothetical protein